MTTTAPADRARVERVQDLRRGNAARPHTLRNRPPRKPKNDRQRDQRW